MILYYTLPLHIRKSFTKILALEPVLPNLPSPLGPWPLPESSASWPKQPPGDMARDDQLGYVGMIIPETALVVQFHHLKTWWTSSMGRIFSWIIHGLSHTLWKNEMKNLPKHQPVIMFKTNITRKNERHGIKKNIVSFSGEQVLYTAAVFTAWRERKKITTVFSVGLVVSISAQRYADGTVDSHYIT